MPENNALYDALRLGRFPEFADDLPEWEATDPNATPMAEQFGRVMGSMVRPMRPALQGIANMFMKYPGGSAIAGGLAAGAVGLGGSWLLNKLAPRRELPSDRRRRTLGLTLGSGTAGALAAWILSREMGKYKEASVKTSSIFMGGVDAALISRISEDMTLGQGMQMMLSNHVLKMPSNDKAGLLNALSGVAGAGIGLLVARYLLKLGMFSQGIAMLAGGTIGRSMFGGNGLDLSNTNLYGIPY